MLVVELIHSVLKQMQYPVYVSYFPEKQCKLIFYVGFCLKYGAFAI